LRREIEELAEQVGEIPALEKQLADLWPKEQELAKVSADASEKKTKLDAISSSIAASSVGVGALERFQQAVARWQSLLSAAVSGVPSVEPWPEGAGPDPLAKCRLAIQQAEEYLSKAEHELDQASLEAQTQLQNSQDNKLKIEDQARQLRREVEGLQEGAGAIVRQGQQLRERKARLESLKAVLTERRKSLNDLIAKRGVALDRLDTIREKRFSARNQAATGLAETLGPRIRVHAERAGQFDKFAAAIADVLRGSGLRYNELAPMLAKNVSPRELLEAADANDIDLIVQATGITKDRAARVLAQLRDSDLGNLATVAVEDTVSLQLLDGTTYKGIGELSTGQRCTVVLPLVLRHTDRILIVDQPEDHIDNAFIADTLILSLVARDPDSQVIFSTHNANIPVLGSADRVVQLGSDGKRGFPVLASDLNDPSVVDAITTVMEGGAEAFKRRASFYSKHAES
jgi:nucleotide-binding universal stress UspA family protein